MIVVFTGEDGGTTVQQGSCMMSIQAGKGTGLDITALSDAAPDYKGEQDVFKTIQNVIRALKQLSCVQDGESVPVGLNGLMQHGAAAAAGMVQRRLQGASSCRIPGHAKEPC